MSIYKYRARRFDSKIERGKMEANSEKELLSLLRDKDLFLIDCEEQDIKQNNYKFNKKELSLFTRELGTMIASGISLIMAMNIITRKESKEKKGNVYKDIYVGLQQGYSFSECLRNGGEMFPALMINMIQSAESSGSLDKTLMTLANQFDKEYRLANKVKSAMLYPIILVVVTVFVLIVVFTVILPSFFELFEGQTIPTITKIMFGISNFMINAWMWLILFVMFMIALIAYLLNQPKIRYRFDRMKLNIPVFGKLSKTIYTARFARSLCSLYASGVSMIQSLNLARDTINNTYIESQFDEVIRQVKDGTTLSKCIQNVDGFDPKLASSIYIGEESGRLESMLDNIANDFDYDAEVATERMVTLIQPIMIIILGIVIGTVIVSVILPMYSLYGEVGAG